MRKSKEAAAESRKRIVATASQLLRARGLEGTSVADVMHAAGMTHGGFYKHFASKDELSDLAARVAFAEIAARFDERERSEGRDAARAAYFVDYLSPAHIDRPEAGCPVAAFGPDAARRPEALTAAFAEGAEMLIARLAKTPDAAGRAEAIRKLATAIGALLIARSVGEGLLREEVLASCAEDRPRAAAATAES
jgi:TetR/AcrR family transcriptional regulator, transcriptional repressor for nem operon